MSKSAIELKNIYKTFRLNYNEKSTVYEALSSLKKKNPVSDFNALTNVSFSVQKGEMLGIIGHNGSGKSTLLKIISKIIEPTSGSIRTEGKVVPFLQLGAGFHPDLTAIENIKMYGMILGMDKEIISKKVLEILKYAELEKFKDAKAKTFSSGMFARLAFATAIQSEPDTLVIDEVLSVGDLDFQQKSFEKFMEIKKSGRTIVYVTHNLEDVLKLCDRAVLMFKGYIADIGDPAVIIDKYRTVVEKSPEFHKEDLAKQIDKYYSEILERPIDVIGMFDYMYKIKKEKLTLEDIPNLLRNSPEYALKNKKLN